MVEQLHRGTRAETADLVAALRGREREMVADLEALVTHESPSNDPLLLDRALTRVDELFLRHLGSAGRRVRTGDTSALIWESASPRVLVLCHVDTVWPRDTLTRWPFTVTGGRASGPGAFDMKAGLVQALFALHALGAPDGVRVLVTTDEETGSAASRPLIEEAARGLRGALVLEPAYDGALKVARKGVAQYVVHVEGRASHASEPTRGVNASLEMARQMLGIAQLADAERGTTVTPTRSSSGTTANTVPAHAELSVDSRAATEAEQQRVDAAMRALRPHDGAAKLIIEGGINRGPMSPATSRHLFELARSLAAELGLQPLTGIEAPGGSDGQLTAAAGTPTLDGLGAVGGNAHAEGEWVDVAAMPERAALLAALIRAILAVG